jgi:exopolysaccharide biosynthesis polyprenyl glycosylphosphotransferase
MNRQESISLFIGDLIIFTFSLWAVLFIRYAQLPDKEIFLQHFYPFSFLFLIWSLVFFISGLYEKRVLVIRRKLFSGILKVQIINSIITAAFFYFSVPFFGITPKTNLFIYLLVSLILILIWRVYIASFLGVKKRANAILIGNREEIREIQEAIQNNNWYNLNLISFIDLDKIESLDFQTDILDVIYGKNVSVVIVDLDSEKVRPILSHLYNLMFSGIKFMNAHGVYEDIFGRIPLSLIQYDWFLENISKSTHILYDVLKRLMDIFVSFVLLIVSLFFYPFVYFAIKLEDGGSLFVIQERIGRGGKKIKIQKFRSMTEGNDWVNHNKKITKVGKFLRKTSIDELPQLWGVLKGDQSLIGPRPELPELVKVYSEEIPYYNIRHLEKPGLSGWAQIYQKVAPHHSTDIEKTKIKLSYDLYYIKHHSFGLDLKIALKTIKILFGRIVGVNKV